MKITRLVPVLTICLLLYSCSFEQNPFSNEAHETVTHDGQLYILNKRTGDMHLVEDDRLRLMPSQSTPQIIQPKRLEFTETFGDGLLFEMTGIVKQVGDRMMIRGRVRPYIEGLYQTDVSAFQIRLLDSDRFVLGKLNIREEAGDTRIVSEDGTPQEKEIQRTVDIPVSQFTHVSQVNIIWFDHLTTLLDEWLKTDEGAAWQEQRNAENDLPNPSSEEELIPADESVPMRAI